MRLVCGLAVWAALCCAASAQESPATEGPAAATQPEAAVALPTSALTELRGAVANGSIVELEVAETVSSKTHKQGDTFALRLAAPITSDAGVLIPAGTPGRGEVISASRAGMLGKAGELLLAARHLDFNGEQVRLRTFKLGAGGTDNSAAVLVVGMVLPVSFLIKGGDIEIPAGTRANAKLATDINLPVIPVASATVSVSTPNQEESPQ